MSYVWLETLLLAVIFISAILFAIRHFVPDVYEVVRHFFFPENAGGVRMMETSKTKAVDCQTQCSACNGCSLANKS